jgi:hypothetical protein
MRSLRAFAAAGAVLAAAAASAAAGQSPAPPLQRPNPFRTNLSLNYASPIPAPGGGDATLAPLDESAVRASVHDLIHLRYGQGDWGGFLPAPVGGLALGGTAGGVQSFVFLHHSARRAKGSAGAPVVPPPPLPKQAPASQPRANGCFGGCSKRPKHHAHAKSKGARTWNCGTAGLSIRIDRPRCRVRVLNGRPGQGTVEHVTIRNTSSSRYAVSFRAAGKHNPLWRDLQLGVWKRGRTAPTPLPPLRFWTTRFTRMATLAPGEAVRLTIELRLPASAGNGDQHQRAVVDFLWRAAAKR